jgi:hypothetical protein
MARLVPDAQLLALALLNYADDEGYFLAEATLIRSACIPFREEYGSIPVLVQTLINAEWIQITWNEAHGPIGRVINFKSHQVVNKPRMSKLKQYWGVAYVYGTPPGKLPESSRSIPTGNGMDQGMEQGMEGAENEITMGEDMAKQKNIVVQEGFDLSVLMESKEVSEAWAAFLDMRKTMKRPATEYAQKLLIRKLESLSERNRNRAVEILEQSIVKCWQDLFPIRVGGFGKNSAQTSGGDLDDDFTFTGTGG